LRDIFAELERRGRAEFAAEGHESEAQFSVDLRYRGQGYELNVPWDGESPDASIATFHQLHKKSYGFSDETRPVEIVNLRLRLVARGEAYSPTRVEPVAGDGRAACYAEKDVFFDGCWLKSRFYRREGLVAGDVLSGPAMITEYTAATMLPPGDCAEVDGLGNLVISIGKVGHA
jgi:N-methylhydantoinase A